MQHFKPGDSVIVLALKRKGIITALHKKTLFKVSVGSIEIICKAEELDSFQAIKVPSPTRYVKGISFKRPRIKPPTSLDLHGLNSQTAKEALLSFISDAVMAGYKEVNIVHGHGSGILKNCVQSTLANLEVVASFRHPHNNSAITKVYLV